MIDFIRRISDRDLKDSEYKLAQSGDATCNGLDSAEVIFFLSIFNSIAPNRTTNMNYFCDR